MTKRKGDGFTILERVNDRRKRRHEAAIEELRQELAAISSNIEPQVESACAALNSSLEADLLQIEKELEPIEPPPGSISAPPPRPPKPPQPVAPPPPVAPAEIKATKHSKKNLATAHATVSGAGKVAAEKQATSAVPAAPVSSAPASDSGAEETVEEPPPASEQLQAMSYKELDELWSRVKSHSQKRRALIDELDVTLSAIEQRRVGMVSSTARLYLPSNVLSVPFPSVPFRRSGLYALLVDPRGAQELRRAAGANCVSASR